MTGSALAVETLTDVRDILNRILDNHFLWQPMRFAERLYVAEELEIHVVERLDALKAAESISEKALQNDIERCLVQAREVLDTLEGHNQELYAWFRRGIASGELRGSALQHALLECIGSHADLTVATNTHGYDTLDLLVNAILHVEEVPQTEQTRDSESVFYQKTPARIVLHMCEIYAFDSSSVLADLGSGLGQVALLAHLLCGTMVTAIERALDLHKYAERCAAQFNVHALHFANTDLREADFSGANVFYCYDPCRGAALEHLVERLHAQAQLRHITILSYGKCSRVFAQQEWLHCDETNNEESATEEFKLYRFDCRM